MREKPVEPCGLLVDVGDDAVRRDGEQGIGGGFDEGAIVGLLIGQLALQARLLGDVAGAGEDALDLAVAGTEDRGIERDRRLAPGLGS